MCSLLHFRLLPRSLRERLTRLQEVQEEHDKAFELITETEQPRLLLRRSELPLSEWLSLISSQCQKASDFLERRRFIRTRKV